jgi:hypothetical protein
MADHSIYVGQTSKRIPVFIQDSAAGDGSGLTGLAFGTSGLSAYYWREDEGNAGATAITLATMTRGTWATGGFIEKDSTNMPGWYEFGIPDAALAAGASWVRIMFKGATIGVVPRIVLIELIPLPVFAKNKALAKFTFPMVDTSGAAVTGLTITAKRSIDGAALGSCANSAAEISNGLYTIDLAASDLNGTTIELLFTGTGAVDQRILIVTQAITP